MSHKSQDLLRLEDTCNAFGMKPEHFRRLGEAALKYYRYEWMPALVMARTPDSVPVLRDSLFVLGDVSRPYEADTLETAIRNISRLGLLDVLLEEGIVYVRDRLLTDPDAAYDRILEHCYLNRTAENEFDFYESIGMSKSAMYEKRKNLLIAMGLALTGYSAPTALEAMGEWG